MNEDPWDDDGYWVGPPSLRLFLRTNWPFVAFWDLVLTGIALAVWVDVVPLGLLALPVAVVTGAAVTLALMLGFSRGWIAEGD